jgi:uncharacterized protein YjdB
LNQRAVRILSLSLVAAAAACGDSSGPSPNAVATVDVTPATVALGVGQTRQLAASPKNRAGAVVAGKSTTWSSSSVAIATVDAAGLVRGVAAGSATITATVDGKVGTASVTVTALPVATITIAPTALTVGVAGSAPLTATLADSSGTTLTGRTIAWSSASTTIATVSTAGLVTGVAIGSTSITATSEGKSATVTVTVIPNPAITFTASGRVVEAAGTPGVAGARVTAQDVNAAIVATATADAGGNWSLTGLPMGSVLEFAVSATGYVSTTVSAVTITAPVTVENVPLARTSAVLGGVSGLARNASTNAAITTGLAVELRAGVNVITGLAVRADTTAANGTYSFAGVAAGTYTLVMRGAGYAQSARTVVVTGGATLTNADLTLSASANANQWRAVLTWTAADRDLDLYLTLPGAGSSRQQVYFLQPGSCAAAPNACLDRDASAAPGPETITISQLGAGIYRFYVHNYNTPSSATDSTLMRSGALLRVFRGTAQVGSYAVPQQAGTLWTVFEIDGATGNVTPRNVMAAGAVGDTVAALRAPGGRVAPNGKRDPGLRLP